MENLAIVIPFWRVVLVYVLRLSLSMAAYMSLFSEEEDSMHILFYYMLCKCYYVPGADKRHHMFNPYYESSQLSSPGTSHSNRNRKTQEHVLVIASCSGSPQVNQRKEAKQVNQVQP